MAKLFSAGSTIEERLEQIGDYVLTWALRVDTVAMRRLIVAEVERFPELSAALLNNTRLQLVELIAEILHKEVTAGTLVFADARFSALQFLNMVIAPADMHAHYGAGALRGQKKRDYIASVVDLFLNGCRASTTHKSTQR